MLLPFPRPRSPPSTPSPPSHRPTSRSPSPALPTKTPSTPRSRRGRGPAAVATVRTPHLSHESSALARGPGPASALRAILAAAPARFRDCDLSLAYSTVRDGCSLGSFHARAAEECAPRGAGALGGPLLMLVRDAGGAVFGAYAAVGAWRPGQHYFGTGESFVFKEEKDGFVVYPWSRRNNWFQLASQSSIALGGGGAFAFSLDDMLEKGSSGPCETFDSPCLASGTSFDCVVFEAWRLVPPSTLS